MEFTWIDFLSGFFLMNAMPHLLVGLFRIRFLSMFGFSAGANIMYAFVNVVIAAGLFHIEHGIDKIFSNGVVVGATAMLVIYAVTGRFFHEFFSDSSPARLQ